MPCGRVTSQSSCSRHHNSRVQRKMFRGYAVLIVPTRSIRHDVSPGVQGHGSYMGVVKSFNPNSGWGHISCDQTFSLYAKDMFFMRSQVPGGNVMKGATVQFSIAQGLKGPEAMNIRVLSNPPSMNMPLPSPPVVEQQWGGARAGQAFFGNAKSFSEVFFGTVKSFNEEKGWGHICCPQTQQIYGKDMFVMRSAIASAGTIRPDDTVSFSVQAGQKGPEATNVRVMAQSFPYSCEFLGVYQDIENTYFVASLATEGDLFTWSQSGVPSGREREATMRPIVKQIFSAVRRLHDLGISHRDLSLENILLTDEGNGTLRVKLIDFGMATLSRECRREPRGKLVYQAPEMHKIDHYDAFLVDAFALGVTLFAMAAQGLGFYPV